MSLADILDTRDPATVANPYDIYRELRSHRDLVWSDRLGLWLAPTHETANATLRNKSLGRLYQAQEPFDEWEIFNWLHSDSILDSEPPKHTRLRSLVQKAFTPGRIAALEPNIQEICERLLDEAEAKLVRTGSSISWRTMPSHCRCWLSQTYWVSHAKWPMIYVAGRRT